MTINTGELVKGVVSGIVTGFAIGIGFTLAQKTLGSFSRKKEVADGTSSFTGNDEYEGIFDQFKYSGMEHESWEKSKNLSQPDFSGRKSNLNW